MPRDTKIWIGIYAAVIVATMLGIWAGPNNGLRQNLYIIKGACELAILGFFAPWALLTAGRRRRKFAVVLTLVVAMVTAERVPYRFNLEMILAELTGLGATSVGAALSAGYFALKGFRIVQPETDPRPAVVAPWRFSLLEIFALTFLCAILLALRPLLGVKWSAVPELLLIALIYIPFGLISIAAAWAMLMPSRPWLRIPLGLTACGIPWLALAYYVSITSRSWDDSLNFLKYLVAFYAASLLLYATLRKSGFRLLQLTNQNEAAPSAPPAATDPVTS